MVSNLPDKPSQLPEKPGGRIWHEEDQESLMTDLFAQKIEEQHRFAHDYED